MTSSRSAPGGPAARIATLAGGALAARAAWSALRRRPPGGAGRWQRTNHRGDALTLLEGPALAVSVAAACALAPGVPARLRAAAVVAGVGAGAFGVLDDLGERGTSKGLRGHLGALARGEVTTGGVKVAGIGATGLAAAALALGARAGSGVGRAGGRADDAARRGPDALAAGALVAGCANLANLLDLRPGRALKAGLLAAPALAAPHPAGALVAACTGASLALLPEDLGERAMLGDGGANALGAVLGVALVAGTGRRTRLTALTAVVGLTLASERVSFTRVIERTPVLRELDALGRRPR